MKPTTKTLLTALVAGTFWVSACRPPHVVLEDDEIGEVEQLYTLMDAMATAFDDRYDLSTTLTPDTITDADFAQFAEMGRVIAKTAPRVVDFAEDREGFADWARQLAGHGEDVVETAEAKDGEGVLASINAMKSTCVACHDVHN